VLTQSNASANQGALAAAAIEWHKAGTNAEGRVPGLRDVEPTPAEPVPTGQIGPKSGQVGTANLSVISPKAIIQRTRTLVKRL
jgi:hypothetical protein